MPEPVELKASVEMEVERLRVFINDWSYRVLEIFSQASQESPSTRRCSERLQKKNGERHQQLVPEGGSHDDCADDGSGTTTMECRPSQDVCGAGSTVFGNENVSQGVPVCDELQSGTVTTDGKAAVGVMDGSAVTESNRPDATNAFPPANLGFEEQLRDSQPSTCRIQDEEVEEPPEEDPAQQECSLEDNGCSGCDREQRDEAFDWEMDQGGRDGISGRDSSAFLPSHSFGPECGGSTSSDVSMTPVATTPSPAGGSHHEDTGNFEFMEDFGWQRIGSRRRSSVFDADSLEARRRRHANVSCPICEKTFYQRHAVKLHIRSVHQQQRLPCLICGQSFTQKGSLKRHEQVVHGLAVPLSSTVCTSSSATSSLSVPLYDDTVTNMSVQKLASVLLSPNLRVGPGPSYDATLFAGTSASPSLDIVSEDQLTIHKRGGTVDIGSLSHAEDGRAASLVSGDDEP